MAEQGQMGRVGLVPVIAQEAEQRCADVRLDEPRALARTVELGEAVYWSRSRKKLWHKGEESGHLQKVLEIRLDCDEDVVLLKVEQVAASPAIPAAIPASSRNSKAAPTAANGSR
jgi:phosphoribosyl-AMP cyclohydrolase